jgi:hypothetical protein
VDAPAISPSFPIVCTLFAVVCIPAWVAGLLVAAQYRRFQADAYSLIRKLLDSQGEALSN